jgi:hypothetical protein
MGLGADARNPIEPPFQTQNAEPGVVAVGGNAAAAETLTVDNQVKHFPALPAAAGIVAVAGGASMPDPSVSNGTGVVGVGSPAAPERPHRK